MSAPVECFSCSGPTTMEAADLTGNGYRCPACTAQAQIQELQGKPDVAAHLTDEERQLNLEEAAGQIQKGAALLALSLVLVAVFIFGDFLGSSRAASKAFYLVLAIGAGGVGMLALGLSQRHHNRFHD